MVYLPEQYMIFEDCGQWVSSCWKSTTLVLFLMHLYSSISDAEPGKAYRWRGAPVPCVCWYMYLQTGSQANIVWRPHTLPMTKCENSYSHLWHKIWRYLCICSYAKPLTCIGCHIGFIFIRSDRIWLNILLDSKNPRYRHPNRLPM